MKTLRLSIAAMLTLFVSAFAISQTSITFNYTGAPQLWVVPPCVTTIFMQAEGGQGGGANAGEGALLSGNIPVTPGQTLQINVGGAGAVTAGGWNGGAPGGPATLLSDRAGGGGGASDVRVAPYALGNRVIVAGAGGGFGGGDTEAQGGNALCTNGANGANSWGGGGGGGTAVAGGTAGGPWGGGGWGGVGALGNGGNGGVDACFQRGPGGGGGGGRYGGGGAGSDCWAGGGSYGGGGGGAGSSLMPAAGACVPGTTPGTGIGDGFVTFTYTGGVTAVGGIATAAPDPVCQGGAVMLTLAGHSGTIQWESAPGAGGPWTPIAGATTTPYMVLGIMSTTCFRAALTTPCPPVVYSTIDCVTVIPPPNAGADNAVTLCNTAGSTFNMNTLLSAGVVGGTWAAVPAMGAFNPATGILTTGGLAAGVYNFTYTATAAPCPADVANFTVTINAMPNAGPDNSVTLCNTAGSTFNMNTLLGAGIVGGTWAAVPAIGAFNPATGVLTTGGLAAGVYNFTYTKLGVAPCPNDVANFTVTINPMPNAGTDNSTTLCNTAGSTFNMNTLLGGGAMAGGTWAAVPAMGAFNPATGVLTTGGLAAGVYNFTYTVLGVAPCPNDVANFTVTINQMPNAGTDNSTTLCNTAGSTFNMNTLLGGGFMAGGTWAAVPALGAFNPATGVLTTGGLAAGAYNFTYTVFGTAPCPNDVANFTVTINPMPNAGPDGGSVLCNTAGSTVNLNTLLVGATPGGTWVETTIPVSGAFTPATGLFNAAGLAAGAYTFTYTVLGLAPCPNDVSSFTITITDLPVAGLDGATQICNSAGSSVNMNTLLSGADPGGTWAAVPAMGAFTPATGILNTAGLTAGVYNFTYTLSPIGPCPGDVANFSVTVQQVVNAGADGATQICNTAGSSVNLTTLLSGADAGGTWAETTIPASGSFTPATAIFNTAAETPGVYTFTYTKTGVAPCPNDVANFTVTVQDEVNAGANNTTQICNTAGSTVNLNAFLVGADAGGTWSETTIPASGTFTPATGVLNTAGLAAGAYTFNYTVLGVAPCPNDIANFTVTVQDEVTAGLDNATQICNTAGSSVNLNTLLTGADAGGVWAETSASGSFTPATGIFNTAGETAGIYTFTYTKAGVAPCPNDVANFTVTVQDEVNAGADNTTQICNTAGSTVNLNTLLVGADAGGTWTESTASGSFTAATGILNTAGLPAGVYTFNYTVFGVAPCPNDVSAFTVTVQQEVFAGANNTSQICNLTGSSVNLNTLLLGADAGGVWLESTSSGAFIAATGMLNTAGLSAGAYNFSYTVTGVAPCPNDVSNFVVTVQQEVFAGSDNATRICNLTGSSVNMNTLLTGADAGGAWTETTASASFTPATGTLSTSALTAGIYTFDYTVTGVAPCPNDVSTFTVTVEQEVFAGADNVTQACNYPASTVDLNPLLSGADAGGVWAATGASTGFVPATGILNLTALAAGTYTYSYTVTGVAPCPNDVSNFTVTVDQVPTVTPLVDEELCDESNHVTQLFGSDVAGTSYTWDNTTGTDVGFGLAGAGNIGGFTGATGSAGDVIVTVEVIPTTPAGCVGNPITFDITVHPLPVVNLTADKVIGCEPLQVFFTSLSTGSADCLWSFGDGTSSPGCGVVSNVFETAGTYDITLDVTTAFGCFASLTIADYITVSKWSVASFAYTPNGTITIDDTKVEFINTSIDADGYEWTFGDGSPETNEVDPSHTFPGTTGDVEYTVRLVAQSDAGCPDTAYQSIRIENVILFWIPNTFTPNDNGTNDLFKPYFTAGIDIFDFHFTIFNRWGEIVFESFNPAGGWAGSYGDRGVVEDGAYVWQLEFGETMSDKKHQHRGHVTILK